MPRAHLPSVECGACDDTAETALRNVYERALTRMANHDDASLGPTDDRHLSDPFVPRATPLGDGPESEVGLYAHLRDLRVHAVECPRAAASVRAEVRKLLHRVEESHPKTRHSVMAGGEELPELSARRCGRRRTRVKRDSRAAVTG